MYNLKYTFTSDKAISPQNITVTTATTTNKRKQQQKTKQKKTTKKNRHTSAKVLCEFFTSIQLLNKGADTTVAVDILKRIIFYMKKQAFVNQMPLHPCLYS